MVTMMKNQPSQWWWLDNNNTAKRSSWLQSTLSELNEKTKRMLKLIEEDADSFAQRAEMYYKKRPELLIMVEDFYRTHRSLAERYDQIKPEPGIRFVAESPFASAKNQIEKLVSFADNGYDTYSENCYTEEDCTESEVDDPEQVEEENIKEKHVSFMVDNDEVMKLNDEIKRLNEEKKNHEEQLKQKDIICDEVMKLREEMKRLREENKTQMEQLKKKDEEKLEVIRQLSLAIDIMKQENVKMRKFIAKEGTKKLKKNPFELSKFVGAFSGKLFNNGTSKNQPCVELSKRG
ncbi:hypothetical protein Lal_00036472 [Lupinus albus]|uniref:Uncharacterized protein n=1 Tax=Lupinus albus TaxID=3870 RepID=A0A6A4NSZ4_LUPAL|nr:putative protein Networked (NET), actin-binding (NAB) [Lupinus albus]KAF1892116.1 hypothetical protein Lal_00036472 [Lupinus albus]